MGCGQAHRPRHHLGAAQLGGRSPDAGMGVARMVGHITYLSAPGLAEKFGRPVGTIKTWLHRGLASLKACLTGS